MEAKGEKRDAMVYGTAPWKRVQHPITDRVCLRRPRQVHVCTGTSANLVQVICLIYLLFLTRKFDDAVFWPN